MREVERAVTTTSLGPGGVREPLHRNASFGTMTTEETERTMNGFIDVIIPAVREMEREHAAVLTGSVSK